MANRSTRAVNAFGSKVMRRMYEYLACKQMCSFDDDDEGGHDAGPKGELEYWRNRMQRLTSITEQLKRKVRNVPLQPLAARLGGPALCR